MRHFAGPCLGWKGAVLLCTLGVLSYTRCDLKADVQDSDAAITPLQFHFELDDLLSSNDDSPKPFDSMDEPLYDDAATTQLGIPPKNAVSESDAALAQLSQNLVARLVSVAFQSNFNFGYGPNNVTQYVLNVQPVIPFKLNDDWSLITRTTLPVINQPSPGLGISSAAGLGDLNTIFLLSPTHPRFFAWGLGPAFTFPTGSSPALTSGKYSAGFGFVALRSDGPFVYGALINPQWSFAGWGSNYVNTLLLQPFVNINFRDGWYFTTYRSITANWNSQSHNTWTVPVGGGFGKVILFRNGPPVDLELQAFSNVVRPQGGAAWSIVFQIKILVPR